MKYAFYGIFIAAIIALSYYLIESIRRPVHFHNTWAARKTVVHKQLEDIVELQKLYKILHNDTAFAGSFDDMLSTFINDSFTVLKIEGDPYDTLKKADTIQLKFPARDSVASLLAKKGVIAKADFDQNKGNAQFMEAQVKAYIDKMRKVPFSNGKEFEIKSGEIALEGSRLASNFSAPTFEVSTKVGIYMPEFEKEEYSMYNPEFEPEKVVKVGDLNKLTTSGNW